LPVVLLLFVFCVLYVLGKRLLDGEKRFAISFMLLVIWLFVYSGLRRIDEGFWFLLVPHHGRVLLWLAFIPLCFWQGFKIIQAEKGKVDWFPLFLIVMASGLVSSMSIALVPLCIGILSLTSLVLNRDWKKFFVMLACTAPNVILGLIFLFYA